MRDRKLYAWPDYLEKGIGDMIVIDKGNAMASENDIEIIENEIVLGPRNNKTTIKPGDKITRFSGKCTLNGFFNIEMLPSFSLKYIGCSPCKTFLYFDMHHGVVRRDFVLFGKYKSMKVAFLLFDGKGAIGKVDRNGDVQICECDEIDIIF